jgi:hypothetical protein
MIFIGIDISINSTAICIDKNNEKFLFNYTNMSENYKWNKILKNFVTFRHFKYSMDKNIMNSLIEHDNVTNLMINDMGTYIDNDVYIMLEGFNYGLNRTNIIIDIVQFSTILKLKIHNNFIDFNKIIEIISPKTLKLDVCNMVYKDKYITNNKVYRNNRGIAGGNFEKSDMLMSLLDYDIDLPIKNIIISNKNDIISKNGKTIRKPFDDIIDSIWLSEIIKMQYLKQKK